MSRARGLHRALARVAAVAAVAWAGSGMLHPLIVAIGPKPASFQPPAMAFDARTAQPAATLLAAAGREAASALRYVAADGHAALQLGPEAGGERTYLDATTGAVLPDADRLRAVALARHYAGRPDTPIARTRLLTAFEADYPPINRLLPVWAIEFDAPDHAIAFVDTGSDRLGTLNDRPKRIAQRLFQWLHTLNWIGWEPLRLAAVGALVRAFLLTVLAGATLLVRRGGSLPLRVWHRRLAWLAVLPALGFPLTGLFKLALDPLPQPPLPEPPTITAAALAARPFAAGDDAVIDAIAVSPARGAPVWRVIGRSGPARLVNADGSAYAGDDADLARQLAAAQFGAAPQGEPQRIVKFDADYGFVSKRLPVWRLRSPDGVLWHFDARDGRVAARGDAPLPGLRKLQAASFDLIHKGHLLDPSGLKPDTRNLIWFLLAALLLATALLGYTLRRRSPAAATGNARTPRP